MGLRTKTRKSTILAAAAVLGLAGCQTSSTTGETLGTVGGAVLGGLLGSQVGGGRGQMLAVIGGAAAGALIGREIGSLLDPQDQAAVERETVAVLEDPDPTPTASWANAETSASATVTASAPQTVRAEADIVRSRSIAPPPPIRVINQPYKAVKGANIRQAPSTDAAIEGGLGDGQVIDVIGAVIGRDWYLVGRNGISIGYVHAALLAPIPKADHAAITESGVVTADPGLMRSIDLDAALPASDAEVVQERVTIETECRTAEVRAERGTDSATDSLRACRSPTGVWEIL